MKVLFLLPYPIAKAPSQRFRVEQLLPLLDEAGIRYTLRPFMDEGTWNVLYRNGSTGRKAFGILKSFFRRAFTVLAEAWKYDYVFIHREAAPLGPPVFEWLLARVLRRKLIFDFDDAIWIPNTSDANRLVSLFKAHWKTAAICRWSYRVAGGNDYLCSYAAKAGAREVVRIPTIVDTERRYNRIRSHMDGQVVIGWTGSHSTLPYLDMLRPVLDELHRECSFRFLVIADRKPDPLPEYWDFRPWDPAREIEDLLHMDIGVMPLTADAWSEGKCGFKLIQYMALGIPAVASPVGVNSVLIEDGHNGFLAGDAAVWKDRLRTLLKDKMLRESAGKAGREKIVSSYSLSSVKEKFIGLFEG